MGLCHCHLQGIVQARYREKWLTNACAL
jgi:hypothetical protein